jgi:hypothetical protein
MPGREQWHAELRAGQLGDQLWPHVAWRKLAAQQRPTDLRHMERREQDDYAECDSLEDGQCACFFTARSCAREISLELAPGEDGEGQPNDEQHGQHELGRELESSLHQGVSLPCSERLSRTMEQHEAGEGTAGVVVAGGQQPREPTGPA